jgi:hypothetical protein
MQGQAGAECLFRARRVSPSLIAACFGQLPERLALEELLRGGGVPTVLFVDDRTELFARLGLLRPAVILFPPVDDAGVPTAPLIARVVTEAPATRPLVLIDMQRHRALPSAIRAGASPVTREGVLACLAGAPQLSATLDVTERALPVV